MGGLILFQKITGLTLGRLCRQLWLLAGLAALCALLPLLAGLAAEERDLDLFLFGHTHKPLVDMRGKTLFLNPGSIGDYARPTYGVVTLENGKLDARTALLRG